MATGTVEERLAAVEAQLARFLSDQTTETKPEQPWWERIAGTFKDDPDYDEAMRLGREYRESQRPDAPKSK